MKTQGVFLQTMAADATEAQFDIIGVIGWEVAFTEMRRLFGTISESVKRVVFNIYSPGGDVWDGNGIVQAIGELGKTRETVARVQVAASMATLIAVACQKRSIASNGRFLIHNAWTVTQGDADDHEKAAQHLRDCEEEAAKFYAARTGQTEGDIRALMAEERWLTPDEAQDLGFVQDIDDPFDTSTVATVRAEIEAAGKWPMALIEIPKQDTSDTTCPKCGHRFNYNDQPETRMGCVACPSCKADVGQDACDGNKVNKDACTTDDRTESVPGSAASESDLAAMHTAEIESARVAGFNAGKSEAEGAILARARAAEDRVIAEVTDKNRVQAKLDAQVIESRKLQGERDQARATAAKHKSDLDEATAKLTRLLSGGLTFTPEVVTWEQAIAAVSGPNTSKADAYEKARKQFPEVYRAQREQDKASRK